ncbi:DUF1616 domain-containing protein [Halosolutus gelatinilyticus]|uniref:DUF1616 domain-containing protein n=1 Tax=Halosolutus gelatinilyticus TaxID=2931975 RepID=UPI001FF2E1B3|nr:DUF1616 domain-containing protein [Halosolutus gelatinilyticus]
MKDVLTKPFAAIERRSRSLLAGAPIDLFVAGGFALVAAVLLVVVPTGSRLLRAAIGAPLLFFVPGYVTLSVLFPRATPVSGAAGPIAQTRELGDGERAAISFGLSLALLPLLGLAIATTPWGFTAPVVVGAVSGFSVVGSCLAIGRRLAVPASERYRVRLGRRLGAVRAATVGANSSVRAIVNVALAISILLSLATVGYAFVAPQQGEQYTDLRLLTEDGSGDFVAAGYPEEIGPDESIPLVIAVENQEREDMEYTVVVQEQRVEDGEVVDRTELQRIGYTVGDGETAYGERNVTPTTTDGDVRISVLLYRGEVPTTPTSDNAYRYTHVWTEVTDSVGDEPGEGEESEGENASEADGGGEEPESDGDADAGDGTGDEGGDEEGDTGDGGDTDEGTDGGDGGGEDESGGDSGEDESGGGGEDEGEGSGDGGGDGGEGEGDTGDGGDTDEGADGGDGGGEDEGDGGDEGEGGGG